MTAKERREARQKLAQERINTVPEGFKVSAEEWAAAPESIRLYIWRRLLELQDGIEKYRWVEGIKEFDEIARASGTTLADALARYTSFEQAFKRDPVLSTARMWAALGVSPWEMIAGIQQHLAEQEKAHAH